jgi:hypothetical protein
MNDTTFKPNSDLAEFGIVENIAVAGEAVEAAPTSEEVAGAQQ